jgi:hypothetical protein
VRVGIGDDLGRQGPGRRRGWRPRGRPVARAPGRRARATPGSRRRTSGSS